MKRGTKRLLVILPVVAGLILTACEPLSKQLIAAVEDDYSPVIVVDAPSAGGTYYSTIDVSGHVDDDSLASGDNIGLLSSLSFEIAADPAHRGRITISSSGDVTKDAGYGSVDITYNSADRGFSFSVPTSDLGYPPQILYLRLTAVDFNGNESTETIQLIRSEGPYVDLTQPAGTSYVKGGSFTVAGTVADSFQHFTEASAAGDPISADEVATLRLDILALGISAELDIEVGETSVDLFPRSGTLAYDAANRAFLSDINLLSSDDGITSLTISVLATDLNGNVTTVTHSMTQIQEAGPVLQYSSPVSSGEYYYSGNPAASAQPLLYVNGSSRTSYSSLVCTGWVYSLVSGRLVATAELQFSSGGYNNTYDLKNPSYSVYYDPAIYGRDYYNYTVSLPGSTFQGFDGNGTAEVTLTAVDNTIDARTSTVSWIIREDSDGPDFSSMNISASNGSAHVGIGQTVTLSFNLADGSFETGLDASTLAGSVAGIALASGDFVDSGSGSFSVDVDLAAATQGSGALDISITAEDYIGNPSSLDESDFDSITFYEGTPSITTVSIAADAAPADAAKPGDSVTLTITADQDMEPTALDVEIAGVSAAISGSGSTLTATATIPGGYTTNPVDFEIISFENMVGTAGTLPADPTATTDGSEVDLYVGRPTLDTRTITTASGDRYAASGENIIVSITSSQPLDHGPTVDIGGNSVAATGSGTSWTATTSDPSDGEGTVALSFSDIVNIVGTVASPSTVTGVTSGDDVIYYPGTPALDTRTVTTVGGDEYAASGETITVSFTSSQPLDHAPTVDIGGNSVTATGSGTSWTATTSDPSDGEGTVTLSFSDIQNLAGTASSPATITGVTSGNLAVYYPGAPALTGVSMTLVEVGGGTHPDSGDIVTLDFTVANGRVLQTNPTVTFTSGGALTPVVKDTGTSAPDYKYEYTLTSGDLTLADPISYTIDFTDAAGTAGTQVAAVSTVDLTP